jgi:MEMO1 family protein
MSIVLAAFVPHTPLLLPTADPTHAKHVAKLRQAMEEVVQLAHAAQVQTVIAFSPHAVSVGNTFSFNLAPSVTATFEEFGDMTTTATLRGDPGFLYHLKEVVEPHYAVAGVSQDPVNYGNGIPLLFFSQLPRAPKWGGISIRRSTLDEHYTFGVALQSELVNARERIMVLASGDVTARLTDASPAGVSPEAKPFWSAWQKATTNHDENHFIHTLTPELVDSVASCGAWSLAMLAGTLNTSRVIPHVHYTKELYGVGYQVVTWQPS